MEGIIKDIQEQEDYFEVLVEKPDLAVESHQFKKGHGWEEEVTFNNVTKPRWLIKLEQKYAQREEAKKQKIKNLTSQKKWVGKRFKDGKLKN